MSNPNDPFLPDDDLATEEETEEKIDRPRMYRVLLHNDNYTTMEFVVFVLIAVFHHSESEAVRIMLAVHRKGVGVAGTYEYEIAETKAQRVRDMAQDAEYPLQCSIEPE